MKTVLVNIVVFPDKIDNLQELLPKEYAAVEQLKNDGFLEHLFLKDNKEGVYLILKNVDLEKAKDITSKLPLFSFFEDVDYTLLDKQF